VLAQLGNRIQHALRAYTPKEQEAVKVAAKSFRENPDLDTVKTITELGVGEVLISTLDEKGIPTMVDRAFVIPPVSQIGPIAPEQRQKLMNESLVAGVYEKAVDRESAFEILKARAEEAAAAAQRAAEDEAAAKADAQAAKEAARAERASGRNDSMYEALGKSVARAAGSSLGREIVRGVLGSMFGGTSKRKKSGWF
jgi:hypothetical protein